MNCQTCSELVSDLARDQMMDAAARAQALAHTRDCANCAVGTVRSRLHRARAILAEKLEPARDESSTADALKSTRCFA